MTSFLEYHDYFKWIADNHTGIASFHFGGVEDILGFERSGIQYPCLWLEPPSAAANFEVGTKAYTGAFAILAPLEVNDLMATRLAALDAAETIVEDIIGKLHHDWEERQTMIDPGSITYDMLDGVTSDYDWGWRVEFRASKSKAFCYNPSKFGL